MNQATTGFSNENESADLTSCSADSELVLPKRAQLAQVNVSRMLAPLDSLTMADFVAALPSVNAVADRSPGFVWRFQSDEGNATYFTPYPEDPLIIFNMSVWNRPEDLVAYLRSPEHRDVLAQRRRWFEKLSEPTFVMWWIPAGVIPSTEEGLARLEHLRCRGESPLAFSSFSAPPAWTDDLLDMHLPGKPDQRETLS